jgi:hypothetical protein
VAVLSADEQKLWPVDDQAVWTPGSGGEYNRKCGREGVDGLGYGLVDMWAPCRLVGMSERERMENESERRRTENDGVRSLQPRIHDLRFL